MVKVKIKTWEAMEKEFGLDGLGDIQCKRSFTKRMEEVMLKDRIVELDEVDGIYLWYSGDFFPYVISSDMIEKTIESESGKEHDAVLLEAGDVVECISSDILDFESRNWLKLDGIKVGDLLIVDGYAEDAYGMHLILKGKMFMHHASKFRKIEKEKEDKKEQKQDEKN